MVIVRSKIKWAVLGVGVLSLVSLIVHLLIAEYSSSDLGYYSALSGFHDDLSVGIQGIRDKRLWRNVKSLEPLQPYANPRTKYPAPTEHNNGFIYAKVFGGFEQIRTSICDLVTIARLLNATLVIPEIQESTSSRGISSKFKSFSYVYNEDQFMAALRNDVIIVKSLPPQLKEARKRKQYKTFKPKNSASPEFYTSIVLLALKKSKVVGLVLTDGGCLQSTLPPSLDEYQRLRCRVAFHAFQFRPEILALGRRMVERLRSSGQPYLAFHPGLVRDSLAYHGCAELFEDVHSELIQYRRAQMIKQGILREELSVDSFARKANGTCPLSPEEVGLLFRTMGYNPTTRIYLAGTETFGGQRAMIPLRAMYSNVVDRTSLCSKQEIDFIIGPETPIPPEPLERPPAKSAQELKEEWDKAGPRPRPLPPPPQRPFYQHEKEGWYGWVAEKDAEPDPSPIDLRNQAHRLLWGALDYIVSVEADAFFPGFDNDGIGGPDFSGLVMGHRLYEMASSRTYRPDRKYLAGLFSNISDRLYYPKRNWTLLVRNHLNRSLGEDGLLRKTHQSKSFLSHPVPQCSCINTNSKDLTNHQVLYRGIDECPSWMHHSLRTAALPELSENETEEDENDLYGLPDNEGDDATELTQSSEQDEEMDPDD